MYEEQRLRDFYSHDILPPDSTTASLPLGSPYYPAHSQGLQLVTNGDVLIGRADNSATLSLSFDIHACTPPPITVS